MEVGARKDVRMPSVWCVKRMGDGASPCLELTEQEISYDKDAGEPQPVTELPSEKSFATVPTCWR